MIHERYFKLTETNIYIYKSQKVFICLSQTVKFCYSEVINKAFDWGVYVASMDLRHTCCEAIG